MVWWTLRQLKADDWRTREAAAKKLGEFKDPRSISPLIAALGDKNSHVRHAAESALIKLGNPAIMPLIVALKDSNPEVRQAAQQALIRMGNSAVLALGLALSDSNLEARETAAATLGKIGDETAIDQLIAALKYGDSGAKEAAAAGLVRIGQAAVAPLVNVLKENKPRVRDTAAAALVRIGRPAIEPLIIALKDSEVRGSALEALSRIDPHWTRSSSARLVLPVFVTALQEGDDKTRKGAATVLGEIGDPAAFEALSAALSDPHEGVQEIAATALGALGDLRAVGPLVATFSRGHPKARKAAVAALMQIGSAAVEPLMEALKDKDNAVREASASVLVRIGNAVVEPLVDALWKIDPDWAKSEAAEAVPRFVAALKDGGSHLMRDSRETTRRIGDVKLVKPLTTAVKNREAGERKPGFSAAKTRNTGEIAALSVDLDNPDPRVREAAIEGLRQIVKTADDPLGLALKASNPMIRRAAAHALAESGDSRGRDALQADLRDSTSKLIVLDAAESLAKLGDASALEPLAGILRNASASSAQPSSAEMHETKRAFQLLLRLVEHHAQELTVEDLRSLYQLHHKSELVFVASVDAKAQLNDSGSGHGSATPQDSSGTVNYAAVRDLARRELTRRNLKA